MMSAAVRSVVLGALRRPPYTLDFDFVNGRGFNSIDRANLTPDSILTYTSPSPKMVYGNDGVLRYAPHNLFLNSGAPATQNVTLITGLSYTVTVTGSGSLAGSSGASGTASAGSPATFVATGTTGTFTLTGSLTTIQINRAPAHAGYIPTTTDAVYSLPIDHNPTTFAPLGVLIEEQRTNLLTYSEQFDNAAWSKTQSGGVTVTSNQTTSPDGVTSADLAVPNAVNGYHVVRQGTASTAAVHTHSLYVKASGYTKIGLREDYVVGQWAAFNLSTGAVIDKTAAASASITAVGNGWYRLTLTPTTASVNMGLGIYVMNDGYASGDPSSYLYTGNGTSGAFIWGAQLEAGAFATSYIPTVASQVTRLADQVSILTSAFAYNQTEGTLCSTSRTVVYNDGGAVYRTQVSFRNAGNTNFSARIRLQQPTTTTMQPNGLIVNTTTQADLLPIAVALTEMRSAFAYKLNDAAMSVNGAAAVTDGSCTIPSDISSLEMLGGAFNNGATHIKRLTYFPTRKSNSELQALTA